MRGCLKRPSPSSTPRGDCSSSASSSTVSLRKCVAFGEDQIKATVYPADEWDRTPTEPARNLSEQDLRELLEIQTSLPMANQSAEFLKNVPVGLLRLLPEREEPTSTSTSTTSTTTDKTVSPIAKEWNSISFKAPHHRPTAKPTPPSYSRPLFVQPPPCPRPVRSPWTPAHLAHLAPAKVMEAPRPRERPRFTFVPLLDPAASPSPSSSVPSSAEPSRAPSPVLPQPSSSLSLAPLSLTALVSDHPELCHSMDTDTEDGGPPTPGGFGSVESTLPPPSPLALEKKKRRFIVVNDMEIPLDDD